MAFYLTAFIFVTFPRNSPILDKACIQTPESSGTGRIYHHRFKRRNCAPFSYIGYYLRDRTMQSNRLIHILRNDVNLLATLCCLLEKKHLDQAGKELFIGQSAVSHRLARLREIFNDRLLVRTSAGTKLTPLAEQLLPQAQTLMQALEQLFCRQAGSEDIRSQKTLYRVCLPENIYTDNLPALFLDACCAAGVDAAFEISSCHKHSVEELNDGNLDFFFGPITDHPKGVHSALLAELCCHIAVRPGHPLAGLRTTPGALARFPRAELYFGEPGAVPDFPEMPPCGKEMKTVLKTMSASTAVNLLLHSDAWCILPSPVIDRSGLATVQIPGKTLVQQHYLCWHHIVSDDTFHAFVRRYLHQHFSTTCPAAVTRGGRGEREA